MKSSRYFPRKLARDFLWMVALLIPQAAWCAVDTGTTAPVISEQQAIQSALNTIESDKHTITVTNPRHRAVLNRMGVQFTPRRGPSWHWRLTHINDARQATVPPTLRTADTVDFAHSALIERYLIKADTIEQRFVLERPWPKGQDLVITGAITSNGKMHATGHGWTWRDDFGVVTLSEVTVFDATGKVLPARMQVTDTRSTIRVAAGDLANAVYPVTIDPEIGTNDFRISDMGTDGDTAFGANNPAVVYNAIANEYLVVWQGDNDTGALEDGEFEIFGQRIDAATGAEVGTNDFRISDMGTTDGDTDFGATTPAVAWNEAENEYLVVWRGDDDTGPLVDDEIEIFGQLLDGATGAEIGADFRISQTGTDGNTSFFSSNPAVVWNATNNEYLVVWSSNDGAAPGVNGEEIFGQRIDGGTGADIGIDFRISDMGPDGAIILYRATNPALAWTATNNEYLVVWQGDDDTGPLVDDEIEIYGQRIDGVTGAEVGTNDFRISDMGTTDGDASFSATSPAVTWNATDNEYLVVWQGDDDTGPLVNNEFEIFGQRIDAGTGIELGADFRISDMGLPGNPNYDATNPAVTWNLSANEYLVVWQGDDDTGLLVDNEIEIFGRRLNSAGILLGTNYIQLSDMGITGDITFEAISPAVAYNTTANEFLVVWSGDDNTPPLVNEEFEIFGQLFSALAGGGGGGGSGCTLNQVSTGYDPVLPLLILLSTGYLLRRRVGR